MIITFKKKNLGIGLASEICIWKDKSNCGDCKLDKQLFCRPKLKYMMYFILPLLIGLIPVIFGVLFSNFDIIMKLFFFISWLAYAMFFFSVWESHMLCNHCPYYANDAQKTLHCPIDKGKLKTGKYKPGPLSFSEKVQFFLGSSILFMYPIPFLIIGGLLIPLIFLIIGVVTWIIVIQLKVCIACVNFACPLNRVNKDIKDEFFRLNPIIKEAWEKSGYKFKLEQE